MIKRIFAIVLLSVGGVVLAQGTIHNPVSVVTLPTQFNSEAGFVISTTVPGSDQAADDGKRHFTEINIPYRITHTGAWYFIGSVGGTDSVALELFTSAGVLVTGATTVTASDVSGDIVGSAATIQSIAWTDGTITLEPGRYFLSAQFNGTTAKFRSPAATGSLFIADEDAGTAFIPASITPGTAWVTGTGIIGGLY